MRPWDVESALAALQTELPVARFVVGRSLDAENLAGYARAGAAAATPCANARSRIDLLSP